MSLNKPRTTSYGLSFFFFLTYQLSCEMRYLILSVPLSLLSGFKRESRVAFCTAAFLVN